MKSICLFLLLRFSLEYEGRPNTKYPLIIKIDQRVYHLGGAFSIRGQGLYSVKPLKKSNDIPTLLTRAIYFGICFFRIGHFFFGFLFPCFFAFQLLCFLLFCFSLLLCFYTSLLLCFSASLLLCLSAFLLLPAFLLFPASLLICFSAFPCFFAYLLLWFSLFFCFS